MISSSPEKAPLTIKRMLRVLTFWRSILPVCCIWMTDSICEAMSCGALRSTSVSSISLSRLRWTPERDTSGPCTPCAEAILSISSMYMMPYWARSMSPLASRTRSRTKSSTSPPT